MVSPTHLLDANTWIYTLKGASLTLNARIGSVDPDTIAFCSIVKAELLRGAHRYANSVVRFSILTTLFNRHISFSFDDIAATEYGRVRHHLEAQGQPIGAMDMLIAAIALANNLILVTHNTKEFSRIPGLKLDDWT